MCEAHQSEEDVKEAYRFISENLGEFSSRAELLQSLSPPNRRTRRKPVRLFVVFSKSMTSTQRW